MVYDPPAKPSSADRRAKLVTKSDGDDCRSSSTATVFGGYPKATCRIWKVTSGMLTGEQLDKGSVSVACQRNLGIENPVYTKKQTNTWWIWTRSQAGTWDWFPETAIAEGAADQPVNGVARCL